jgi:hypothetical protein
MTMDVAEVESKTKFVLQAAKQLVLSCVRRGGGASEMFFFVFFSWFALKNTVDPTIFALVRVA